MPDLTDGRITSLPTSNCRGWWNSCFHPVSLVHVTHVQIMSGFTAFHFHHRSYLLQVDYECWSPYGSTFCNSTSMPSGHPCFALESHPVSVSFSCVLGLVAYPSSFVLQSVKNYFSFIKLSVQLEEEKLSIYKLWPRPSTFLVKSFTAADAAAKSCSLRSLSFPEFTYTCSKWSHIICIF
jgi:hypothetical protein